MKPFLRFALSVPLFLAGLVAWAEPAPAPAEITIVVVDSVSGRSSDDRQFDRISLVFSQVFKARQWPASIKVERFAANNPPFAIELRIFNQEIREETRGDRTFRAWMTLNVRGTKTDFGMVKNQYYPRVSQQPEDALQETLRGAAEIAATKVEAILFPKAPPAKP